LGKLASRFVIDNVLLNVLMRTTSTGNTNSHILIGQMILGKLSYILGEGRKLSCILGGGYKLSCIREDCKLSYILGESRKLSYILGGRKLSCILREGRKLSCILVEGRRKHHISNISLFLI
jgi:hypothetical protein